MVNWEKNIYVKLGIGKGSDSCIGDIYYYKDFCVG